MRWIAAIVAIWAVPVTADVTQGGKTIDCYCTDKSGSRIELGEFICLNVDGRLFTAQCQMSLNVPMWRETQDECLTGQRAPTLIERLQLLQPA